MKLVGIHEIAKLAGVSRQAVMRWRKRYRDFPEPLARLACGPVFLRSEVMGWLRRRAWKEIWLTEDADC